MDKVLDCGDPEFDRFYTEHEALAGGVILVSAFSSGEEKVGIFKRISKAREWMFALGLEWSCVISPFILDDPDYGNVKTH